MKTFPVETSYISICFFCYLIAQQLPSPTYAVAMSLYQINIMYLSKCAFSLCGSTPPGGEDRSHCQYVCIVGFMHAYLWIKVGGVIYSNLGM